MTNISKQSDQVAELEARPRWDRWNYYVFVIQGIVAAASKSIGSSRLLLPYLYVATGAPVFLAGALMPIASGSRLISQVIAAPFISASRTRKWFLFGGWMAAAGGLAAAVIGSQLSTHWILMVVFISASIALGVAKGINGLAFNDLMSLNISRSRRNTGVFFMSAAGGAVTIGVTWFTHYLSSGENTLHHYMNLTISAAIVTASAALIILLFREINTSPQTPKDIATSYDPNHSPKPSIFARLRKFLDVLKYQWFRRYLYMRVLTTVVVLAMPFYAVHSATHHAHKDASGLSAFVIATSISVIICGPLWQQLGKHSQRYSMALGSAMTGAGGVWALIIDMTPDLQTVLAHSFVFALAAGGIQAVNGSRVLFLIDAAPKEELTYYVSASNTVSAVLALVLASFFGYIAQIQGPHWPVIMFFMLCFIAAAYSLSLKEPEH
ncbi:MAG: MFS transporter [Pseudomonadota bacterium]